MINSLSRLNQTLLTLTLLACFAGSAYSADPGLPIPAGTEVSDQKTGSVLFFNYYTSNAANSQTTNTRFSITNTYTLFGIRVHLFFVDSNGAVSDSYICLTKNQTTSFLASDVDPSSIGYLVAIAVDGNGCPVSLNYLSGAAYIKQSTGHEASLPAEAFSALFNGTMPGCDPSLPTATLLFDGSVNGYNKVPRMVAAEKIRSLADGNSVLLVLNRVGGNLLTAASTLGGLAGVLYDDMANPFGFTLSGFSQARITLSDATLNTSTLFSAIVPAGRTGWLKVYNPTSDVGILGAVLNFNASAGSGAAAFVGGHNLRKLTLSSTNGLVVPVFPPNCN